MCSSYAVFDLLKEVDFVLLSRMPISHTRNDVDLENEYPVETSHRYCAHHPREAKS